MPVRAWVWCDKVMYSEPWPNSRIYLWNQALGEISVTGSGLAWGGWCRGLQWKSGRKWRGLGRIREGLTVYGPWSALYCQIARRTQRADFLRKEFHPGVLSKARRSNTKQQGEDTSEVVTSNRHKDSVEAVDRSRTCQFHEPKLRVSRAEAVFGAVQLSLLLKKLHADVLYLACL